MKILMVTAEAAPWLKVGGLADAVAGLGKALFRSGHEVSYCMPRFTGHFMEPGGAPARETVLELPLPVPGGRTVGLTSREIPSGYLHLVDAPDLFRRDGIYGDPVTGGAYGDDAERFGVLAATAALLASGALGERPDVVHCHDHPAALVPSLTWYGPEPLRGGSPTPVVFTIHNLAHQGTAEAGAARRLGLDPRVMDPMGPLEFHGRLNPVKGAIQLSHRVTTVSPGYAGEILRPETGAGLDGVLRSRGKALRGILNGVDPDQWNPATDPRIPHPYDRRSLAGKARNRRALLDTLSLEPPGPATAVVGMVCRLVEQKGIGLLLEAVDEMMAEDLRLAILGAGEPALETGLEAAAARHPGRLAFRRGFDEALAHLIEAGSHMFLMPSLYEPCGLNQMYSMIYGTVPVVRATGGLADTVIDPDEQPARGNGFVFRAPLPVELLKTVRRALRAFRDRRRWRELVERGMSTDHSWQRAVPEYVQVYEEAVAEAAADNGTQAAREVAR